MCDAWNDAAAAYFGAEDQALSTQPETVTDALLVIALAATLASGAADLDMNNDATSGHLREVARYSRRAADFIATSIGRDLSALLPSDHNFPMEVSS
ncbi:hypothetical protein EAH89_26170 [Roseomonas nepalensis]|uniref:Uncharacterized protein n=1 Tax=Muricoccus nepalensis TaxID=1854500 RepID=A0A502F8P1_9PROT|nr:hypothetical protein EAH89_26170 [Roseomonas nepalensis]